VLKFTQIPEHSWSPCWQVTLHDPLEQISPVAHALAQVPQLALSLERLTQVPLHGVRPTWQLTWQVPLEHTSPEGQAVAHAPQ
jgi:hypothetical protein